MKQKNEYYKKKLQNSVKNYIKSKKLEYKSHSLFFSLFVFKFVGNNYGN